jgi:hypothetical protein
MMIGSRFQVLQILILDAIFYQMHSTHLYSISRVATCQRDLEGAITHCSVFEHCLSLDALMCQDIWFGKIS